MSSSLFSSAPIGFWFLVSRFLFDGLMQSSVITNVNNQKPVTSNQ